MMLFSQVSHVRVILYFWEKHFHLQPNPRRGPVRLGPPWVDKSRTSCAKTCLRKHENCTSFLFNSHTGLCTPGAYINEKQPLPSSAEGNFFQSFYCDTSQGFSVITYLNTTACLALLGRASYINADTDCQKKGAYLMSVKTTEKYNILTNISSSKDTWVGCDDQLQEGEFVWKEDGQKMTDWEQVTLFNEGDPNDVYGDEDCVMYSYKYLKFFDSKCNNKAFYVCEMPYQNHFHLQPNPRRGPVCLGPPWVDKSRTSCAKTCLRKHGNCTSFLFNSHTGLCTPGAYINEKQPLPSSAEGDFFQSFYCDTSQGFSVKTYGNTTACLALFGPASYINADADCQNKGAYLMSVKTTEKYNILTNISRINNTWVGCDDQLQEGEFVWKDDGQNMTDGERVTFFVEGDPNDLDGDEDCVLYSYSYLKFFDSKCTYSNYYVCEMSYR